MSAHARLTESTKERIRRAYRLWVLPGMMSMADLCRRFQITHNQLQKTVGSEYRKAK